MLYQKINIVLIWQFFRKTIWRSHLGLWEPVRDILQFADKSQFMSCLINEQQKKEIADQKITFIIN